MRITSQRFVETVVGGVVVDRRDFAGQAVPSLGPERVVHVRFESNALARPQTQNFSGAQGRRDPVDLERAGGFGHAFFLVCLP